MIVKYSPAFIAKLKKLDVKIRKNFKEKILIFSKNPINSQLDNHPLREEYLGYRSIDITANYRAIYLEKEEGDEPIAYFTLIGTHKELFRS